MKTEHVIESAGETAEYIRQYGKTQMQLMRLELAERLAVTMSRLSVKIAVIIIALIASIFLSLAGGLYLGTLWGSSALGFLAIAGVYVLMTFIIYLYREPLLIHPIASLILQAVLKDEEDA